MTERNQILHPREFGLDPIKASTRRFRIWGRSRTTIARFMLLATLAATALLAQQITGALRGTVTDPSGASVASAKIALRNQATGIVYNQITDSEGQFVINLLSPGSYVLQVSAQGFQTTSLSDVVIEVGKSTSVLVPLKVGAIAESIDVKGAASVIDTATATLGVNVDRDFLANLPTTTATRNPLAYARQHR